LKSDGTEQTESVLFNAGGAGVKAIETAVDLLPGEENAKNNKLTRLVNVDNRKPRILYLEGEPRWEFKFLRRAVEDDRNIDLVSILRTTQNKIYRQGISNPKELEDGFPSRVEELFGFEGVILGSVDAAYLTPTQQDLIHQFVDRRGGGLLFLGGRDSLADGGYAKSALNDLLPVTLPDKKDTFIRMSATAELTAAGRDSLITRLEENPDRNVDRWKKLPYLMNFQDPGQPKPGAVVLADAIPSSGGRVPLLITQNFGRGRTAVFATAGSWRWQMLQPLADKSHEMFFQQLLRWLVTETPRRVIGSTPQQLLADENHVKLRAEVRDKTFLAASDATVQANILGPEGIAESVEMRPEPLESGVYSADWTTPKAGSYLVEMLAKRGTEELGRDVLTFRREDGVAENFHVEQNRELLEKLSSETGGRYYAPADAQKLSKEISYSEAGITVRETRDRWVMPAVFLLLVGIRSCEWLLRRKWGVI
ncbi:MAG TPA: glutamine amidotransferase, partial [Bryobacteraceae bacterium]